MLPAIDITPRLWHKRLALASAITIFPLVFLGGLVTSHQAGLSVPDWPNSFGYNMFLLPPSLWLSNAAGGVFFEHAHRLLGSLVGLLSLALLLQAWGVARWATMQRLWFRLSTALTVASIAAVVVAIFRVRLRPESDWRDHLTVGLISLAIVSWIAFACRSREPRRWLRWTILGLFLAVCVQGALGGMRVDLTSLMLALTHGIMGQLVFALSIAIYIVYTTAWREPRLLPAAKLPVARRLRAVAIVCGVMLLSQLTLGATMRHDRERPSHGGAGLAIRDFPLHEGHLLPPISEAGLAAVNADRQFNQHPLPAVSAGAMWLHFSHRMMAYSIASVVGVLVVLSTRLRGQRAIVAPVHLLGMMVIVQITLGAITVLWRKPADIATAHQAGGAILLAGVTWLIVVSSRSIHVATRLQTRLEQPEVAATFEPSHLVSPA